METSITFETEDQFQAYCVQWFDRSYPEHRQALFAVPNGGKREWKMIGNKLVPVGGQLMQSTGTRRGTSDLILVNYFETDFIELKIPGGSQSKYQKDFQKMVEERGHRYYLLWTFKEFRLLMIEKLGDPYGE